MVPSWKGNCAPVFIESQTYQNYTVIHLPDDCNLAASRIIRVSAPFSQRHCIFSNHALFLQSQNNLVVVVVVAVVVVIVVVGLVVVVVVVVVVVAR